MCGDKGLHSWMCLEGTTLECDFCEAQKKSTAAVRAAVPVYGFRVNRLLNDELLAILDVDARSCCVLNLYT